MNAQTSGGSSPAQPKASKGRVGHDKRRQMILQATVRVLARDGAEGTGLRSVCREMAVAPSLMTQFFSGWNDQLTAACNMVAEAYLAEMASILNAPYARERRRARAILACCLDSRWAGENALGAMTAFWQMSRNLPELGAEFERFLEARRAAVRETLVRLLAEADAQPPVDEVTTELLFLVDGILMQKAFSADRIDSHASVDVCWGWLAERLGMPGWRLDKVPAAG